MTARIATDSIKLPSCPDAERALIAAVVDEENTPGDRRTDVIALAGGSGLTPCFESDKHRRIWQLLCDRHAAGKPNALVDVTEACREQRIEYADGLIGVELSRWVGAFQDGYCNAHVSPVGYAAVNAREVRETSERRQKILLGYELIQRAASDQAPLSSWLPGVAEKLGQTGMDANESAKHVGDFLRETMAEAAEIAANGKPRKPGLSTGITALDHLLGGGLQPGRVTLIGGRTSQGKSALAATMATEAALAGVRCVYVSLEMSGKEICQRVLAQASGIPATQIAGGPIPGHALGQLSRAAKLVGDSKLYVIDDDNSWPSILARLYREIAQGAGVVFIDYLQLLQIPGAKLDQWQALGRITAEVKALALRAKIPVVTVAQLNREAAKESRPRLHHLRGSGDLEQDADAVVLIYRQTDADGKAVGDRAELMLEKNRSGQTGVAHVTWDGPLMRFADIGLPEPEEDRRYV